MGSRFHQAHERLKRSVHSYWQQNPYLSPRGALGKVAMSCVYFSVPVVIGYYVSTAAVAISESTVEQRLRGAGGDAVGGGRGSTSPASPAASSEPHRHAAPPLGGDRILVRDEGSGTERIERVGAGGWGGGVHLVTSDRETQETNRLNLERFLKKQRKLKERRDRLQQLQQHPSDQES